MIEFKDNKVKIKCLECQIYHFIDMIYIGTEKEQRSFGFEYEHEYCGKLKCPNCNEELQLIILLYEYPKSMINYIDINNKSCNVIDNIDNDYFNII